MNNGTLHIASCATHRKRKMKIFLWYDRLLTWYFLLVDNSKIFSYMYFYSIMKIIVGILKYEVTVWQWKYINTYTYTHRWVLADTCCPYHSGFSGSLCWPPDKFFRSSNATQQVSDKRHEFSPAWSFYTHSTICMRSQTIVH